MLLTSGTATVRHTEKSLHFAFHEVKGELYVVLGADEKLELTDINSPNAHRTISNSAAVFNLTLREGRNKNDVIDPIHARIIFEAAVHATQMDQSTRRSKEKTWRQKQLLTKGTIVSLLRDYENSADKLSFKVIYDSHLSPITKIQRVPNLPPSA